MNRPVFLAAIAAVLLLISTISCEQSSEMTLEMEVYHSVFENLVQVRSNLSVLLRAPADLCVDYEYEQEVWGIFSCRDSRLVLDSVASGPRPIMGADRYTLKAKFIGFDSTSQESLIASSFRVSESDWYVTRSNPEETKIAVCSFTSDGGELIFEGVKDTRTVPGRSKLIK